MTPIDLLDYTDSSSNIPQQVLKHSVPKHAEVTTWKILVAHFIDFTSVLMMTFMGAKFLELSLNGYMAGSMLQRSFGQVPFAALVNSSLPLMFMSYFFFSYFFNHGQTYGMYKMNLRIDMPELNFRSAFLWSMFSSALVMTGGLTLLFSRQWAKEKGWGTFKGHDHLWVDLMQERVLSPLSLVEISNQVQDKKVEENLEDDWSQAA